MTAKFMHDGQKKKGGLKPALQIHGEKRTAIEFERPG
jgi:hypothetical protein